MPSFDIISELNIQEVRNAIGNTDKEIATRFDFKGSDITVELNEKAKTVTITCDNKLQTDNVYAIFEKQLIKRGVDLQSLDPRQSRFRQTHQTNHQPKRWARLRHRQKNQQDHQRQ